MTGNRSLSIKGFPATGSAWFIRTTRMRMLQGHQTRSRRRPSGLRPNSSEFFEINESSEARLGEKKTLSEFFEID
jgi:hypothetical protein